MRSSVHISKITLIAGAFIWVGMVIGISFLESWLKFQAPGITIDLGVGIGQLVYSLLNKVEILLAVIVLFGWWLSGRRFQLNGSLIALAISVIVLMVQTLVLLPLMDARADLRLSGVSVGPSLLHVYYVAGEMLKIAGLTIFAIKIIQ